MHLQLSALDWKVHPQQYRSVGEGLECVDVFIPYLLRSVGLWRYGQR